MSLTQEDAVPAAEDLEQDIEETTAEMDDTEESGLKKRKLDENGSSTSEGTGEQATDQDQPDEQDGEEQAKEEEEEEVESESEDEGPMDDDKIRALLGTLSQKALLEFSLKLALENMESQHLLELNDSAKIDPTKCKIFVRSLPFNCDDDGLRKAFAPFGKVTEAIVIKDRNTKKSKGFGFVTYAKVKHATRALEAKQVQIDTRTVYCSMANAKPDRSEGNGYSGGSSGGGRSYGGSYSSGSGGYGGGSYYGGGYGGGGYAYGGYGGGGYGGYGRY